MTSGYGSAAMSPRPEKLTEAEFLAREAAQARAALARSWRDTRSAAVASADPRALARRRPWVAVTVAAVGGLIAAGWLFRGKRAGTSPRPRKPASAGGGFWRFLDPLAHGLAEAMKTTLHDAVLAVVASRLRPGGPAPAEAQSAAAAEAPSSSPS